MTYNEFLHYKFKSNHLYNIIRLIDNKEILRGASVTSVFEMAKLIGLDKIKINIY